VGLWPGNTGPENLSLGSIVHEVRGTMHNANPYGICTWKDESACADCRLQSELGCRLDMRAFQFSTASQIPSLVLSVFGLVLVGVATASWWPLVAFGAACLALWDLGLETRVLCSHCPFWAEEGKTLHCLALTGSPKIWHYHQGPLAPWEKVEFCPGTGSNDRRTTSWLLGQDGALCGTGGDGKI
jgi:hypothetical protein